MDVTIQYEKLRFKIIEKLWDFTRIFKPPKVNIWPYQYGEKQYIKKKLYITHDVYQNINNVVAI